jgi:MFS family permease
MSEQAQQSPVSLRERFSRRKTGSKSMAYTSYLLAVLLIAYTFSFIDRQILSLLVEPMKRDLSISDTEISLLQGLSFALFYTFLGLPLGRLADSRSRRGLIAGGIFFWSIMTAICGLTKNYTQLFLARMGVGVGEAALSPAAYSLITDSVDRKNLASAISVYTMGIYLGGGLALIVGGKVLQWAEGLNTIALPLVGEIYSWQLVFLCVGLPGLLLVPLMFTLVEPARKQLNPSQSAVPLTKVVAYFKANKRTILFHNLGAAFASMAAYGTLSWAPTFLIRTHQFDGSEAGLALGLIVLFCGSAGVLSGGFFSDRWVGAGQRDAKIRLALIAGCCGILPGVFYPLASTVFWVLALMAVSTYFSNFIMGLGPAAIQEVVPATMRGQFSALYLFVVNLIGLGLGPSAVALFTDFAMGDPSLIRYSLAVVPTMALILSSFFLWRCLQSYHQSLDAAVEITTHTDTKELS